MSRTKQFDEEEVLQKAINIFWKQGYHATSIEDLVQGLGINRASMYATYGGKRQVFERAVHKYIQDNRKLLKAFFSKQSSVKEGMHNFFGMIVQDAVSDCDLKGCLVVNTSTEMIPEDVEMAKMLAANKSAFGEVIYEFLKTGQQNGEIAADKDIKAMAAYFLALFHGVKVLAKINPQEAELNAIVSTGLSVLDASP